MVSVALLALCLLCLWSLGSADGIIVQEGSNGNDYAETVVIVGGLPVVAGRSGGNFPGTTSYGAFDAIVVKYNMDGSQAATATLGTSVNDGIYGSAIDTADNIVVVGYTDGTLNGSSAGSRDVFIAKLYGSNLNQAWLVQTGTDGNDVPNAVAVDSAGKVILGGSTTGAWDAGTQSNIGSDDAFVMQYDSSGTTRQWVLQVGSSSYDYLYGIAIDKVDSVDDIYAIGYSLGNFDGLTNAGSSDIFLIKVNSTGTKVWSRLVGGSDDDYGRAVVVDSARNVYASGYTTALLPGASSNGGTDAFLMKYDTDGVQQWIMQIGSTSADYTYGLGIDANDILYVPVMTYGSMEGTNLGSFDIAVVQVDNSGIVLWTEQFGTSEYDGNQPMVAVDSAGDLFITGATRGAFSGYTNQGGEDWFVYKIEAISTTTSRSSTTTATTSSSSTTSTTSITTTATTSSITTSGTTTLSTTSTSASSSSSTSTSRTISSSTTSASSSTSTTSSSRTTSSTSRTISSSSTASHTTTTSSTTSSSTSTSSTASNTTTTSSTTSSSTSASSTTSTTTTLSRTSTSASTVSTSSTTSTFTTSSCTNTSSSTWTRTDTRTSATTTEGQEISLAQLEAMEEKRKEEAKEAVAAVEAAETKAVLDALSQILNGSNGGNRSDTRGVVGEVVVKTEAGPVKVAALSVKTLKAGESAKISAGEDSSAEVEIDAGLLEEVAAAAAGEGDMVLLSLAELQGAAAESLESDNVLAEDSGARRLASASALRSHPLSINFRRRNGSKIEVKNLQQPMKMVLQVDDPNATCAVWDEDLAKWSSEGVETLPSDSPGILVCSTRHLSIFGGVISVALKTFECSTFSTLMDAAAFEKLGQPDWLVRAPAIVSICILVLPAVALCLSLRADRQVREQFPWAATESMLMRVKDTPKAKDKVEDEVKELDGTESEEGEEAETKDVRKKKRKPEAEEKKDSAAGVVEALLDALSQATHANFVDAIKEIVSNAETGIINRTIGMIQSHRSGACQATISVVKTGIQEVDSAEVRARSVDQGAQETSRARATVRASIREIAGWVRSSVRHSALGKVNSLHGNVQQNGTGAASSFLERGFLCRLALLLPAVHNWLKLRQLSVVVPYSVRVVLIAMKVISAEALGALWFSSSATIPDPNCSPPSDEFERIVQTITVGIVTAFLGDGIIFILFLVQRKRVVRKTEWTGARKQLQRFWWRLRTLSFWLISILYIACCKIYTWLFLANVREEDATKWMEGVLWTLFQDLLLKPFLVAVILTTMSSLLLCCRPSLKRKIQAQWEEGDGSDQNDGDAKPEELHKPPEQEAPKPPQQEPEQALGVRSGICSVDIIQSISEEELHEPPEHEAPKPPEHLPPEQEIRVNVFRASSEPEAEEDVPSRVVINREAEDGQMDFHGILPGMMLTRSDSKRDSE